MTYQAVLEYISSLETRGWRLGLDRMQELIRRAGLSDAIGVDHDTPRFIHVAGTNGKGSVTAYLQAMLHESGYRTGGFFSPFVYDIRERIQLDAEPISIEDFSRHATHLVPIAESLTNSEFGAVTEFEFKTAMGLAYWNEKGAEWVALEVGLGGRLDATNVVTPACSVIVSIGLDHTSILGETLGEIAFEKAGILKPSVPAIVGNLPAEAKEVVEKRALELNCELWRFGREIAVSEGASGFTVRTPARTHENLLTPLPGKHQVHNMAVAVAAMDAAKATRDPNSLSRGLREVRLPGRFERRTVQGVPVLLDGAHNAESMRALVETIRSEMPELKFLAVFGMVEGHDPAPVIKSVEEVAVETFVAPIDFRRTFDPNKLAAYFQKANRIFGSSREAIETALQEANGRTVLVTGSFYLVGEVGRYLGDFCGDPSLRSG